MDFRGLFARFRRPRVLVYADFIDPFSYIGFHNLRQVAEPRGIEIQWRGFEMNPDTPPEGYELQPGANSDLRPGMWASVYAFAAQAGLTLREPSRVPNTHAAQQLVHAMASAVKIPLIERIYEAYFTDQLDIGNQNVLYGLAGSIGAPADTLETVRVKRITRDLERYRREAMHHQFPGLPGFVYSGRHYFGAQPRSAWETAFNS
jgi:predicted DsbA family dithiol-disulfide isomerase